MKLLTVELGKWIRKLLFLGAGVWIEKLLAAGVITDLDINRLIQITGAISTMLVVGFWTDFIKPMLKRKFVSP